jgi:hypothetical protein
VGPLIGDIAAGSPAVTCAERGMTPAGRGYLHGGRRILVVTGMRMAKRGTGRLSSDPAAAGRVRHVLSGRSDVAEKKMVGGLSFLVDGNMCCGITGTALMVRVGAEGREQALREPHVRPMLFAGRALSGFICIEPDGYATDDALASWVQRGLDFVAGLPAKPVYPISWPAGPARADRTTRAEIRAARTARPVIALGAAPHEYIGGFPQACMPHGGRRRNCEVSSARPPAGR